ncbi:MAG: response regulator transcription factor [Acidimicrobiales bacterium]
MLLSQVRTGLVDLGARIDADRVTRRLRGLGPDLRRRWRGGPKGYGDRLSPSELDVVRLLVVGRTRREIAQVLFKSPRTVDAQVRSAMRKFDVSSRVALALRAVESGLIETDVTASRE